MNENEKLNKFKWNHCRATSILEGRMKGLNGYEYGMASHVVMENTNNLNFLILTIICSCKIRNNGWWCEAKCVYRILKLNWNILYFIVHTEVNRTNLVEPISYDTEAKLEQWTLNPNVRIHDLKLRLYYIALLQQQDFTHSFIPSHNKIY